MELRQLEYFKTIAEHGSINAAAKALHMSQPPLTFAMHQLEAELHVTLFTRSSTGIVLSEAGRVLYHHAIDLLGRSASIAREVSRTGTHETLRFGATPTVVSLLSRPLCALEKKDKKIGLELYEGSTYHLKELLDDGSIDCALIRSPVHLQGYHFVSLLKEGMSAVSSIDSSKSTVTLQELSQRPLIIYRRYESYIQDAFAKYSYPINIICECDDARTAIQFACAGLGTAIVPNGIASSEKRIQPVSIEAEELNTEILFVWKNNQPTITELMELLKKETISLK